MNSILVMIEWKLHYWCDMTSLSSDIISEKANSCLSGWLMGHLTANPAVSHTSVLILPYHYTHTQEQVSLFIATLTILHAITRNLIIAIICSNSISRNNNTVALIVKVVVLYVNIKWICVLVLYILSAGRWCVCTHMCLCVCVLQRSVLIGTWITWWCWPMKLCHPHSTTCPMMLTPCLMFGSCMRVPPSSRHVTGTPLSCSSQDPLVLIFRSYMSSVNLLSAFFCITASLVTRLPTKY